MPKSFITILMLLLISIIFIRPVQPLTYKLNAELIYNKNELKIL